MVSFHDGISSLYSHSRLNEKENVIVDALTRRLHCVPHVQDLCECNLFSFMEGVGIVFAEPRNKFLKSIVLELMHGHAIRINFQWPMVVLIGMGFSGGIL